MLDSDVPAGRNALHRGDRQRLQAQLLQGGEAQEGSCRSSKYAKQIMQAMRPVFSDLLQDLQRSIGYYQSLHRDERAGHDGRASARPSRSPVCGSSSGQQLQMQRHPPRRVQEDHGHAAARRPRFAEHTRQPGDRVRSGPPGRGPRPPSTRTSCRSRLVREQMWHAEDQVVRRRPRPIIVARRSATTLYHPLTDRGQPSHPDELRRRQVQAVAQPAASRSSTDLREGAPARTPGVGFTAENMRRFMPTTGASGRS